MTFKKLLISIVTIASFYTCSAQATLIIEQGNALSDVDNYSDSPATDTITIDEFGIISDIDFFYSLGDNQNPGQPLYDIEVAVTLTHGDTSVYLWDPNDWYTGDIPDSAYNTSVNITFNDDASADLCTPPATLDSNSFTGEFKPLNRGVCKGYDYLDHTTTLAAFNGQDIHGDWTITLWDAFGEVDGTDLLSWGVKVTYEAQAVPEPSTWLLMLSVFGVIGYARRRQ